MSFTRWVVSNQIRLSKRENQKLENCRNLRICHRTIVWIFARGWRFLVEKQRSSWRSHDFQSIWALETNKSETWKLSQFTKMRSYESMKFRTAPYKRTKLRTRLVFFGRKAAMILLVGSFPIKLKRSNPKLRNYRNLRKCDRTKVRNIVRDYFFWPKSSVRRGEAMSFTGLLFPIKFGSRNAKIRNSIPDATYENATVQNIEF